MQLVEQYSATQPPIDGIGDHWLSVDGARWERSVMLAADCVEAWDCPSFDALSIDSLQAAIAQQPEVLLLATGPEQRFPSAQLRLELQQQGLGLEVMDHRGAARTYNLLISEGRRVVALFLLEAQGEG